MLVIRIENCQTIRIMSDPLERLQEIAAQEGIGIRERQEAEEDRLRKIAEADAARLAGFMEQQRIATEERSVTLAMAWAAAELLKMENVLPHTWSHNVDLYEKRGRWFPREVYTDTVERVSLQGWPLLSWQNSKKYGRQYTTRTVVLAETPLDENDDYLAVIKQKHNNKVFELGGKLKPNNILALPENPLSKDDAPWPVDWETPPVLGDKQYGSAVKLSRTRVPENVTDEPGPEFARYNSLTIEKDIQQALGRLLALHGIFEPANAIAALAIERPRKQQ
jgi:hypothetical protein